MDSGRFYFLKNKYYKDFNDPKLMNNKDEFDESKHKRPCFYAFKNSNSDIYWLIPISSQVDKYKKIYKRKISKGKCDTLVFGTVLGKETVFLIQNMCPVTEEYIKNKYLDTNKNEVRINELKEKEIKKKASKVLALQRKGYNLIYPDVLLLERKMIEKRNRCF